MKIEVDCRGLNCPEPVLRTKSAMAEQPGAELLVVVDHDTAKENVLRFARSQGRTAEWHKMGNLLAIKISGSSSQGKPGQDDSMTGGSKPIAGHVLFIANEQLGRGSSELGQLLMRNFIYTLTRRDDLPRALILMNSGVSLSVAGSPVIEELAQLQDLGVQILVCGTCLDYYQLQEKHRAGEVSNMYDIADLLFAADKVIRI